MSFAGFKVLAPTRGSSQRKDAVLLKKITIINVRRSHDRLIFTNEIHGPLAIYVKLHVCMRRECRERFPRHRR